MRERDFLMAGFSGVKFSSPEKKKTNKKSEKKQQKNTQMSSGKLFPIIPYLTKYPERRTIFRVQA